MDQRIIGQQSDSSAHVFDHALKLKTDTLNTHIESVMCFGELNSIDY